MSLTLIVGGDVETELATTSGWAEVSEWADRLDPTEAVRVCQLIDHGWTIKPEELAAQLAVAKKAFPPSADVDDVLSGIVAAIKGTKADATIVVSDGTNGEDSPGTDDATVDRTFADDASTGLSPAPDFNGTADESIKILDRILDDVATALAKFSPLAPIIARVDQLVAQADFASQVAGMIGLFRDSGERFVGLALPDELEEFGVTRPNTKTRFPWLEKATQWLIDQKVVTPPELEQMAINAKTKATTSRWKSVANLETLQREIVIGFQSGESVEDFIKRVRLKVDETKPMLETAFRTATHQAYSVGATTAHEKPAIKTLFPGAEWYTTIDGRERREHHVLDHLVFEVGSEAYDIATRALMDYSCRCIRNAISARKWAKMLASGKEITTMETMPAEVLAKYGR